MKKTILVTGAAGNLGKTITNALLNQGHTVLGTLGPHDDFNFIEHENLKSNTVNLFDEAASQEYIDFATSYSNGAISSLICLVGGFAQGNIENTDLLAVQKMIDLNFTSAYNITRPLLQFCKKNNNPLQIIYIGSRPVINPGEGKNLVAYGLAKSLLFKLADYINADANTTGITASIIIPSTMDTPGTRAAMPNADPSLWVPMDNVADTVSFILSDTGKMMRTPIYKLFNKS